MYLTSLGPPNSKTGEKQKKRKLVNPLLVCLLSKAADEQPRIHVDREIRTVPSPALWSLSPEPFLKVTRAQCLDVAGLEPGAVSATKMPELAGLGHSCPVFLLQEHVILR